LLTPTTNKKPLGTCCELAIALKDSGEIASKSTKEENIGLFFPPINIPIIFKIIKVYARNI
jgi:hypothetical protein